MLKPGKYKNFIGDSIDLVVYNENLLTNQAGLFYSEDGNCLIWCAESDHYVRHPNILLGLNLDEVSND